jgi:asparagine synthase (glutamine-hydrolysing)
MPGLFGFYQKKSFTLESSQELLARMKGCMQRKSISGWTSDTAALDRFAAGRVSLGTLDPASQPVISPDKRYLLFFDGQIYEYQPLKHDLKERGYLFTLDSEAELIMNLFLDQGKGFIHWLKGIFVVIIYDQLEHTLILANDRYGLFPLYCKNSADHFSFASELKALLPFLDGERQINVSALCDFYNFHFIMGDKTFLADIQLFPYATIMEVGEKGCCQERYWDYPYQNRERDPGPDILVEEGFSLIKKAVRNQWKPGLQVGIPLSGGLDSRLLGIIASQDRAQGSVNGAGHGSRMNFFHAGSNPRYLETQVAQKVCGFLDGEWHFFDLRSIDVSTLIPEVLTLNDSHFSCRQSWLLGIAKAAAIEGKANILLDGFCFDAQLGSTFSAIGNKNFSMSSSSEERIRLARDTYCGFKPEFARQFFTPDFSQSLIQITEENIRKMSEDRIYEPMQNWLQYFCFVNRARRFTIGNSWVGRNYIESAFPYMDYDLFDFCLRLPAHYRHQSWLYRQIFLQYFPNLARIPWGKTGLPLHRYQTGISCLRDIVRGSAYYLNRMSRGQWEWGNLDINGNRRFRKDPAFRQFFLSILQDSRTSNRGMASREGIENLIRHIDSGKNYFHVVEAIVTVESFFRSFVD